LSHNHIEHIKYDDIFIVNSKLEILLLNSNNIGNFSVYSLRSLTKLRKLSLKCNKNLRINEPIELTENIETIELPTFKGGIFYHNQAFDGIDVSKITFYSRDEHKCDEELA